MERWTRLAARVFIVPWLLDRQLDSPNWHDSRPDGVLIVCRCTCVEALAVAAAISLFNFQYGAALATVAGVLIEVP
jgi:hypothetical protein